MTRGDIVEELESHLRQRVADNLARGMSMADATREAEQRFGSLDRTAASCARVERRRQSPWRGWRHDLRAAVVGLRRAPATTTLGVVIAAAGLTVTLAVAMLADALLFSAPAGVRHGGDLRIVMNSFRGDHPSFMPYETCTAMAAALPEASFFCRGNSRVQVVAGDAGAVRGAEFVTAAYFEGLGTRLEAGRGISIDDERAGAAVAVVSNGLARSSYGEPAAALGRSIGVNGRPVTVIGVAERGFQGQMSADPADIWVPVSLEPALSSPRILPDGSSVRGLVGGRMGWLMGVVRPTADLGEAEIAARLSAIVSSEHAVQRGKQVLLFDRAWLTPFAGDRERLNAVMQPLAAAVVLTLLLTAACLSSLFMGRLISRRQELAVRETLGAPRGRIARLVVVECGAIIVIGAAIATPAALSLLAVVSRLQLTGGIRIGDVATSFDARGVFVVTLAAAVLACVAIPGPLLFLRRIAGRPIHGARLVSGGTATRRVLMAAQVALGCALLAGAGLLTRSIAALERQPLGFDAAQIGYLDLEPAKSGLSADDQQALLERVRADSSVDRTIAAADHAPFGGDDSRIVFAENSPNSRPLATPAVRVVGPYFELLGIRLIAGQTLEGRRPDERVMVIGEPLAEYFWPGQAALGRQIRMGGPTGEAYEVIGIVSGVRDLSLRGRVVGRIYLPLGGDIETLTIMRRSTQPAVAAGALVQQYRAIDARLIPVQSGAVSELVRRSLDQRLMLRLVTSIVGVGSLVIVGVGVWGLAHSTVTRRWREFGLRLALGAERREVVRLAMTDAVIVTVLGGGAGLLLAWQFGRALEAWLFGVRAWDPVALAAALALVAAAVVAGNSLPARQAGRLDPATLLRHE